jgi:hypothetical protein
MSAVRTAEIRSIRGPLTRMICKDRGSTSVGAKIRHCPYTKHQQHKQCRQNDAPRHTCGDPLGNFITRMGQGTRKAVLLSPEKRASPKIVPQSAIMTATALCKMVLKLNGLASKKIIAPVQLRKLCANPGIAKRRSYSLDRTWRRTSSPGRQIQCQSRYVSSFCAATIEKDWSGGAPR